MTENEDDLTLFEEEQVFQFLEAIHMTNPQDNEGAETDESEVLEDNDDFEDDDSDEDENDDSELEDEELETTE